MNWLDWMVVAAYMLGMLTMSAWLGRRQQDARDYYVGGYRIGTLSIALSTMATQCSTNSLLGAPAFVIAVGGLLWLQYELAVPLAMIACMLFLLPFFRRQRVVSVYEYLERRFGPASRTLLSVLFQFLRAFSTGVTVYGIALVVASLTGISFRSAVLLIGGVTIAYDFLGGIRAVIYSDVLQMAILYAGIAVCLAFAVNLAGGWSEVAHHFPAAQSQTLDFAGWGLTDGRIFAFWPMLLGGFFLYLSYYGCDQTQVQRELSARDVDAANMSLFLNGILRFPLVLTYCLLGAAIGAYAILHPEFTAQLANPATGAVDYNLAVPAFCVRYLPHGVIGLIMAALFAAAMSSLDSTINSLSAVTMRDIIERFLLRHRLEGRRQILWARLTTVFWGGLCMAFAFCVGDISVSIIESINKIGSLVNGPILGTFLLATLTRRTNDFGAVTGILAGFAGNCLTWMFLPGVSWLWWNVSGCLLTCAAGYGASHCFGARPAPGAVADLVFHRDRRRQFNYRRHWERYQWALLAYFVLMLAALKGIEILFRAGAAAPP